jgi:hypothetical protein
VNGGNCNEKFFVYTQGTSSTEEGCVSEEVKAVIHHKYSVVIRILLLST